MEQAQGYTIHFTYELVEDAIAFPLQATVIPMPHNSYLIHNIRLRNNDSHPLIPSVLLIRHEDRWIYAETKKPTALTLVIGKAIETHTPGTGR